MNKENFHILNEIKKFDTSKLVEVLGTNGLSDCTPVIESRNIDGESFLNLTEVQLKIWKNLTKIQVARLWSCIQLAQQRPKEFYTSSEFNRKSLKKKLLPEVKQLPRMEPPKICPENLVKNRSSLHSSPSINTVTNQLQSKFSTGDLSTGAKPPIQKREHFPPLNKANLIALQTVLGNTGASTEAFASKSVATTNNTRELLREKSATDLSKVNKPGPSPTLTRPLPKLPGDLSLPRPPDMRISLPSPTADQEFDEYSYYEMDFVNFTSEPWYKDVDRKNAGILLENRPNGSFVIRPSSQAQYVCILTLMHNHRQYNLPIIKDQSGLLKIGGPDGKLFISVKQIVDFYTENVIPLKTKSEDAFIKLHHLFK